MIRTVGDRHPQVLANAYHHLGVDAALKRDYSRGLRYSWKAYELAKGQQKRLETTILSDIAQMLLEAGHPGPARAGFASLLADSPDLRNSMAMLGGYAVASAALDERDGVEWATRQVMSIAKMAVNPRYVAQTLLECSDALTAIGQAARAGTLRRRSLRLAERYGFHDLTFKAEPALVTPVASTTLTVAAEAIAARVSEMEPEAMPHELVYAD